MHKQKPGECFNAIGRLRLPSLAGVLSRQGGRAVARFTLGGFVSATFALSAPVSAHADDTVPAAPTVSTSTASARADGDWMLRCLKAQAPARSAKPVSSPFCEASLSVAVQQDEHAVEILKLAVSPVKNQAGKEELALVALTPLDVLLSSGFGISAGKAAPKLYPFRNCNHLGCFVVIPLDARFAAAFGRREQGSAWFRLANGKVVRVVVSLHGFAGVVDKLASGKGLPEPTEPGSSEQPAEVRP